RRRFDTEATRNCLQGGEEIGEARALFLFVCQLVSRCESGQRPNPGNCPENDCCEYTGFHRFSSWLANFQSTCTIMCLMGAKEDAAAVAITISNRQPPRIEKEHRKDRPLEG